MQNVIVLCVIVIGHPEIHSDFCESVLWKHLEFKRLILLFGMY